MTTVFLLMFSFVGTLPLFYFLDDYRYDNGVQDQFLVLQVLFYSSVNIIIFLCGVIFARKVLGFRPVPFFSHEIRYLSVLQKALLIIIYAFCVFVLFIYLKKIDKVAIIIAITESVSSLQEYRSDMGNSFQGNYHWYKLVMRDVGSLLTFASFVLWLNRKNLTTFIAFSATLGYSVFVAIMATQKSPLAWLLIGLFMTYVLVRNNGLIPIRKLIPFVFAIISLLVVTYIFFMGSDSVGSALWSVFSRAFSGSISPAYFYLEFFPAHQDYLLGRTFPNPGGLMPYEPYQYTIEVMNWRFPSLASSGVVGTAPTVFWGEAYANFGPVGIPIVAFIMGGVTAVTSYLISKIEINPISIGFVVWLILKFRELAVSGFSAYFYNVYIISLVLIVFVILSVRGCFRIRRNNMNLSVQ
ncbi:oligosaccharide repeat unit polymerase [Marinobacter salarius]|uniref:Oligosaccharide repeat unit polymerase n=2 Tax=Marinobacter salarius TaxID=1420917 RepID=A0A1W6K8A7_9GAMM|nr:oligosaccharide repeat unit polymerase [Marinobacter salarius]